MPVDHLTPTAVTAYRPASFDVTGQPVYGAAIDLKGRVEWADTEIRMGKDQLIKISGRLFLKPDADIAADDRVIINGNYYRVIRIEKPPRIDGNIDHVEALISEEAV